MDYKVMRATETWQQAGAYYVRIQAMAKQYHITLREEFDEHDTPDTKYIVILDGDFPVATCRLYELPEAPAMMLGRIVVLPEYRKQGLDGLWSLRLKSGRGSWDVKKQCLTAGTWQSASMRSWGTRRITAGSCMDGRLPVYIWRNLCERKRRRVQDGREETDRIPEYCEEF